MGAGVVRFNEAGPQGAGKPQVRGLEPAAEGGLASMRPARKGPENLSASATTGSRSSSGFNEAGPQGAGKPGPAALEGASGRALQ